MPAFDPASWVRSARRMLAHGRAAGRAVAGAGTSAALGHSLNGTAYRTFTAPLAEVKRRSSTRSIAWECSSRASDDDPRKRQEILAGSAERRTI